MIKKLFNESLPTATVWALGSFLVGVILGLLALEFLFIYMLVGLVPHIITSELAMWIVLMILWLAVALSTGSGFAYFLTKHASEKGNF